MEFFRIRHDIPFMSHALKFNVISGVTFLLAVVFLVIKGLHFNIEFTGGTVIELKFASAPDISAIRTHVDSLNLGEASVQSFGSATDLLVRLPIKADVKTAEVGDRTFAAVCDGKAMNATRDVCGAGAGEVRRQRVESVGSQVGKELAESGALALLIVVVGIAIYLAFRFEWRFAVSTIIANLHDVVIILGFFAFFQWEFSLSVLAAVLAVLGYSVNESVVIADRIRENFRSPRFRRAHVADVINNAITTTLSRTIITHGCTLIMVLSILFFGGETLHYFALALAIGIVFGVYSSALVMAALVMWLGVSRENLVKPEKKTNVDKVMT
ncbi:MAG: protein translocase subunit SecF [Betaproteobacteria bacterium]|nr:protein translocase subunit SecF [Betaproteobacteria bacterium]